MKKKIQAFLIFLVLIISVIAFSEGIFKNTYDDGNFKIGIFKGWDLLDFDKEYYMEDFSSFEEPYDFIVEQKNILKAKEKKYFKGSELKELFETKYTPLIISVYAEKYKSESMDEFAISSISGDTFSLAARKLPGRFAEKYMELSGVIGAYHFIHVPEKTRFECFFLLPKNFMRSNVRVTFEMPVYVILEVPADSYEVIQSRIEYLKSEIKRLEALINEAKVR